MLPSPHRAKRALCAFAFVCLFALGCEEGDVVDAIDFERELFASGATSAVSGISFECADDTPSPPIDIGFSLELYRAKGEAGTIDVWLEGSVSRVVGSSAETDADFEPERGLHFEWGMWIEP